MKRRRIRETKLVMLVGLIISLLAVPTVNAANLPDAREDGISLVKSWAQNHVKQGEESFNSSDLSRLDSPTSWANEIVYLVFVDRFNNGNADNDLKNIPAKQQEHKDSSDLFGLHYYKHGGDLRGIIERLDYLQDLGVTSLWLTPIFHNTGSYHAYNTLDYTRIDPNFGTKEELRELVTKAHKRGIKVILDVVANHMGGKNSGYATNPDHQNVPDRLSYNYWTGGPSEVDGQAEFDFGDDFFGPLKSQHFFNRAGANSYDEMAGTGSAAIFGDFTDGMYDFNTMNHDFQEVFTNLMKYWIAYADVDGFRVDAAKHITSDFIAYFSTEVRDYAQSIGKDNFFIVGEVAGPVDWQGERLGNMFTNPKNPADHGEVPAKLTERIWDVKDKYLAHDKFSKPGLNSIYNFIYSGMSREALLNNKNLNEVEGYFSSSEFDTVAKQSNYNNFWNLLEIHDWPRFTSQTPNNPWKSKLGLSYLATSQGMPVINYGMEQGFNGNGHWDNLNAGRANDQMKEIFSGHDHALYRQNMFISGQWRLGSTVEEIDSLAYVGKHEHEESPYWQEDPYLNLEHAVYKTARRMNYIRRSSDALRYGRTEFRWADYKKSGLMAFSRIHEDQEVVVLVNNASYPIEIPNLSIESSINQVSGEKYKNLLTKNQVAYTYLKDGAAHLTFNGAQIQGNSVMVFAHENNLTKWSDYLGSYQITDNPHWPPYYDQELSWLGATYQYPKEGNISSADELWVNTETYPQDTAKRVVVEYSLDEGQSWQTEEMYQNGTTENNDKWHLNLGTFAANTTVQYKVKASSADKIIVDANQGANYSTTINEASAYKANYKQVYFRGTANDWGTMDLELVSDYTWQTEVTFNQPGRFKFDIYGDWTLNFGDNDGDSYVEKSGDDISIKQAGVYLITFNDETKEYSLELIEDIDDGYKSSYEQVYFRGTPNEWDTEAMQLVGDYTWEIRVEIAENDRFKFDIYGDWSLNFGDNDGDNYVEQSGDDIYISEAGSYKIQFNDSTNRYSITKL